MRVSGCKACGELLRSTRRTGVCACLRPAAPSPPKSVGGRLQRVAAGAPGAGLWEQAQPGWRSAADMQGAAGRMPDANVRRRGTGSPEPRERARFTCEPYEAIGVDEIQWHHGHTDLALVYQIDGAKRRSGWPRSGRGRVCGASSPRSPPRSGHRTRPLSCVRAVSRACVHPLILPRRHRSSSTAGTPVFCTAETSLVSSRFF